MTELRHLEDIVVGRPRTFGHYELTEDEIVSFAARWDPQPFHLDHEAARASVFGEIVACAAHLFAVSSFLIAQDPEPVALLAGLGGSGLRLKSPGRIGDVVQLRVTYLSARPSASRPDAGVVENRLELVDLGGRVVIQQEGAILVARRPGRPDRPEPPIG